MAGQGFAAPVYFASREIAGARLKIRKGEQFPPSFDKQTIRWLAPSLGVKDDLPFGELPYVQVLNAGTEEMATMIREKNLNYEGAKRLLGSADA